MTYEFCPYCGATFDKMTVADHANNRKAVECTICHAQGPKKETTEAAIAAFKSRTGKTILELDTDPPKFVVTWGYDRFLLTLAQAQEWQSIDTDTSNTIDAMKEKRKLLTAWQLLPAAATRT